MDPSGKGIKMNKKIIKSVVGLITGIAVTCFSFILLFGTLFTGEFRFYSIIILTSYVGIIGLLVSWVKSKYKQFLVFVGIMLVSFTVVAIKIVCDKYDDEIPVVTEAKLLLNEYAPFSDGSKIALLDSESTLKLNFDLPKIDGATALYPLYSSFVNATYPSGFYDPKNSIVLCTTTSNAYENLINKKVDVIFCAEPSKEQMRNAELSGVKLNLLPIGYEAFVFFNNSQNPVSSISSKEIVSIYTGKITNWKELGGRNEKIKVFQRPVNSGSQTILLKIMGSNQLIEPLKNEVVDGMGGIIEQTADYKNYKNAIGYSFLFY